ncbi:hypothetical protein PoB_000552700 [Plakobranchus ocellatus]|uniref:CCHC-type domain-containing protein n=1 Tax=Plakobranchus ocellatus TaxID=259542 RepID=A0AAV3Y8B5_9GAST|nr:hypothetical protein PoB_000552700 [Plakobranchus ocellatus]
MLLLLRSLLILLVLFLVLLFRLLLFRLLLILLLLILLLLFRSLLILLVLFLVLLFRLLLFRLLLILLLLFRSLLILLLLILLLRSCCWCSCCCSYLGHWSFHVSAFPADSSPLDTTTASPFSLIAGLIVLEIVVPYKLPSPSRYTPQTAPSGEIQGNSCYVCNGVAHLARQCPSRPVGSQRPVRSLPSNNTLDTISVCSYCFKPGYTRQNCFHLQNKASKASLTACVLYDAVPYYCYAAEFSFSTDGALSIESAKVFGRSYTLLRDSGRNTAAVKEVLVPTDCLTGRVARATTLCCQNRRFPTAILDFDCDYFSGPIEACVLRDSVAVVILRNIKGVRSRTVAPMVNVATRGQSKCATTEVLTGPQEILSKSLVETSMGLHYDPTTDIISTWKYFL